MPHSVTPESSPKPADENLPNVVQDGSDASEATAGEPTGLTSEAVQGVAGVRLEDMFDEDDDTEEFPASSAMPSSPPLP